MGSFSGPVKCRASRVGLLRRAVEAGTSRGGRLLEKTSRIDGRALDWSEERMSPLYR
jgi:hypothetical protein